MRAGLGATLLTAVMLLPWRTSQALEAVALDIVAAAPALQTLWPGFWSTDQAFLLYQRNGECVLVSRTRPESGFHPGKQPSVWRGRCAGSRFSPPFLLGQSFGGIRAPAVRVGRRWPPAVAETLLHESFHLHQRDTFRRVQRNALRFDFATERTWVEFKLHESALLIGAVAENDAEQRRMRIATALTLRSHRLAHMDPAAGDAEDHFMRIEGSAEWLGMSARAAMDDTYQMAADLKARWRRIDQSPGATWERLLRWQSYPGGAAALQLLQESGVDWRAALSEGDSAWNLLERAFPADATNVEQALRQAHRFNRWAGVPRSARELLRQERRSSVAIARFESHRGRRLELRGRAHGFDVSFSASDIHSIDDGVLVRDANPLVAENDWVRLDARRRPFRVLDRGGRLIVLVTGGLRVEGCEGAGRRLCEAGTRLIARGINVTLKAPAWLEDESALVRLEGADQR